MVARDMCVQNSGQRSSATHNILQERCLVDQGKALMAEDTQKQIVQEDQHIQKLQVVNDESVTSLDLVGLASHPNTIETLNNAPTIEPLDTAPTVGAFTVQCAQCMKWRFIPTKEQYEVIRQSIEEKPFFCSSAATWRPNASCSDPLEISPELHELWAVDRPSIPLAPDGWERLLVIRPHGSSKFADIYYVSPSGRKLRSMPEIVRYLKEHPEYAHAGLKLSQFSFLIPKPLDKDHCKKKNEILACNEKGTLSQKKAHLKNFTVESYLKRIVVQRSFKGNSSKPKLEKLRSRKKAELQVFQAPDQIVDSLEFKQAIETSLRSEELEKQAVQNSVNTTSGLGEVVNAFLTSTEQHPRLRRTEVQGAACPVT